MENRFINDITSTFNESHPLVIVDDSSDELGPAILTIPASKCKEDALNSMLHLSRGGTVQAALSPTRAKAFQLEPMGHNRLTHPELGPSVSRELISVEAREGVSTGISVADRSLTTRLLGAEPPQLRAIVKPGHIFPIRVREGGVLVRGALPEAAVDIARLSGHTEAACFLDILNDTGEYRKGEELLQWLKSQNLKSIKLSEIVHHRLKTEKLIYRVAEVKLPTKLGGEMRSYLYRSDIYKGEHLALVKGDVSSGEPVLVRVQPENTFRDVFGLPNTFDSISAALSELGKCDRGVLVYLRRPDSGPMMSELTEDKVPRASGARMREYGIGAQILRDLGVSKISLLGAKNTPLSGLHAYGLDVVDHRSLSSAKEHTVEGNVA